MKTTLIAIALVLTGCAQTQWTHAHGDPARFERDRNECIYEAEKALAGNPSLIDRVANRSSLAVRCMETRGYRQEAVK